MEMSKEKKVHQLEYCLKAPNLDTKNELVMYKFDITAGLVTSPVEKCSTVIFDLQSKQELHSWQTTQNCCHKNILRLSMVKEIESKKNAEDKDVSQHVFLEPYTGILSKFIESMELGYSVGDVRMIPSILLKQIFSQIIDGLSYLMSLGKYHGNLSLKNTYYHLSGSELVVKLANFKQRGGSIRDNQLRDCVAVGAMLDEISKLATERNKDAATAIKLDACQIDHLSAFLKNINKNSLPAFKKIVKGHLFFWDKSDRKRLFIFDVQKALKYPAFATAIKQHGIILTDPWVKDDFDGFLTAMNQYRSKRGLLDFNDKDAFEYIQFASGSYVHEEKLKEEKKVKGDADHAIQQRNPRICYQVNSCMPF